jgi:hypothetical protein
VLEPLWLDLDVILEIHDTNLRRYGGITGVRDQSLLESALAQGGCRNLWKPRISTISLRHMLSE